MWNRSIITTPVRLLLVLVVTFLASTEPAAANEAEAGSRTLHLIRHGYYDWEDERPADVGKALVPLGVAQSRLVASRLRATPLEWSVLRSSTLTRARETAQVIGRQLGMEEILISGLLSECTPPTWREDIMEGETPESLKACEKQIEEAFATFFVPSPDGDRHEIIVAHGNVIRFMVTKALGVDTMAWLGMTVSNCSITTIRIDPDGAMKVLAVGDVGHIPADLQTPVIPGIEPDLLVPTP